MQPRADVGEPCDEGEYACASGLNCILQVCIPPMGPEPGREQTGEFLGYSPEPLTWPPGAPLMAPLEERAFVTRDQIL